jgi:hypothetical protein
MDETNIKSSDSGDPGENGNKGGDYTHLWRQLKEDFHGLPNIIWAGLGVILLIFSPSQGWQFEDFPFLRNYSLAYRPWLAFLCFAILLIRLYRSKRSIVQSNQQQKQHGTETTTSPSIDTKSVFPFKSLYVHFGSDRIGLLNWMSYQVDKYSHCPDPALAMLSLVDLQVKYGGTLYTSPEVQPSIAKNKYTIRGQENTTWCWWRWEGGDQGFQLLVSLCQ